MNAHCRTQKGVDTEVALAADGVSYVRSRVVPSPQRIRWTVAEMRDVVK